MLWSRCKSRAVCKLQGKEETLFTTIKRLYFVSLPLHVIVSPCNFHPPIKLKKLLKIIKAKTEKKFKFSTQDIKVPLQKEMLFSFEIQNRRKRLCEDFFVGGWKNVDLDYYFFFHTSMKCVFSPCCFLMPLNKYIKNLIILWPQKSTRLPVLETEDLSLAHEETKLKCLAL